MHPVVETFQWRSLSLVAQIAETRCLLKHNGLFGESNEELLSSTLGDYLDDFWTIGSGEIVDIDGLRSPQCDIVIYNAAMLPRAFRSKTGKVVIPAHAVGALIEVKTAIDATGDDSGSSASSTWKQAQRLAKFAKAALDKGNQRLLDRAQDDLFANFAGVPCEIPTFAFAYTSDITSMTLHRSLNETIEEDDIGMHLFILDVKRDASRVKSGFAQLGENPGKDQILEFAHAVRMPNGHSFSLDDYLFSGVGKQTNVVRLVDRAFHGPDCLRLFVKQLSSSMHKTAPGRYSLSPDARENLYSAYHT